MNKHTFFFRSPNFLEQLLEGIADTKYPVKYRDNYDNSYIDLSSHFKEVSDAILKLEWNKNIKEYEFFIRFYFGETMPQARAFYRNVEMKSLIDLLQSGWRISANLNLSFVATKLIWMQSPQDSLYFNYWKNNQLEIKQKEKQEALNFLISLDKAGIIHFNATQFDNEFTKTDRDTVNFNPAFLVEYRISQNVAIEKDREGKFVDYLKSKMREALSITNKTM